MNVHKVECRKYDFCEVKNWLCCNLSAGVALNAQFTTNRMHSKKNTIYVAQTSNNRVIVVCKLCQY